MSSLSRLLILIALVLICFGLALGPQSWVAADDIPIQPPVLVPPDPDSIEVPPDTNNLGPHGTISPGLSLWDVLLLVQSSLVTI
jgi:hypothetical protein